MSKRSVDSRMVGTPRAVCTSWCTPAPCDSGATTSEASFSVVPGIRSARWLVTTKAIWPWVSTAALERPVVPEVKKNQQGSSYSTAALSIAAPACADIASLTDLSPNAPSPIRQVKSSAGLAAFHRRGVIGKIAVAEERLGAGRGREIGHLVRHQPEIGRHPDRAEPEGREHRPEHLVAILGMHQDAVALDDAARGERRRQRRNAARRSRARSRISSPQTKPMRSPWRRAFCVSEMREVHDPARHPRDAA